MNQFTILSGESISNLSNILKNAVKSLREQIGGDKANYNGLSTNWSVFFNALKHKLHRLELRDKVLELITNAACDDWTSQQWNARLHPKDNGFIYDLVTSVLTESEQQNFSSNDIFFRQWLQSHSPLLVFAREAHCADEDFCNG